MDYRTEDEGWVDDGKCEVGLLFLYKFPCCSLLFVMRYLSEGLGGSKGHKRSYSECFAGTICVGGTVICLFLCDRTPICLK